MENTKLIVYKTAMHLVYSDCDDYTVINECSRCTYGEEDITTMSDKRVTEQLLLCQQYGFYPQVEFKI